MSSHPSLPPDTPLSKLPNFDPRVVPVIGIDGHLPHVAHEAFTPDALRQRFATPPAWEPEIRAEPSPTAERADPALETLGTPRSY